jgi:hypothetical protein
MDLAERVLARYLLARNTAGLALVHKLAQKYAHMLGVTELPKIVVRNNLGAKWLGRLSWKKGQQNVMEIQESALGDEPTLERIVAHEMAHHVEMMGLENDQEALAKLRVGIKPQEHGERWQELAKKINSHVGDASFVTRTSDQSYVLETKTKPYLVLIEAVSRGSLGYAIGVRLSPKMQAYVDRHQQEYAAKLVTTTDPRWADGAKIGNGWSMPREPEGKAKLQALYDGA